MLIFSRHLAIHPLYFTFLGHYISDVYSVKDSVWKSFNDSHVTELKEEDVRQKRQTSGYIFFYVNK